MAEKFLEEIYEEAYLITKLKDVAEYCYYREGLHVYTKYDSIMSRLIEVCKKFATFDVEKAKRLLKIIETIRVSDFNEIMIGDLILKKMIPLIEEYMKINGKIQVTNEEEDYEFESTDSGFLTIKHTERNYYYHSTDDPMWEAKKLVKHIYDPQKKEYAVWGCGLGYVIYQLYEISNGSIKINVFEPDSRMVEYAKSYGVLDWIPEENINVVIDKDILPFLQCAQKEDIGMYIFVPELSLVEKDVRQLMIDLRATENTKETFKDIYRINFWRNINSGAKLITQFDRSKLNKEYVIVAAGPSLDDTLNFVKKNKGKRTIIAVGTVFKKLIAENIVPDLVVVLDPQERTYRQIEGIEEQKVPMLMGIAAYWKFAVKYQGEKYLIPHTEISEVVEFASDNNIDIWNCGGTVTSLGIEIAIRFGAEKIFLVGVDLAYPNGVSHASNTMDREIKETAGMHVIEDVNGNEIHTTNVFLSYREWIEDRIQETANIKYYNMSKIGAKIKGTYKWQE